MIKNLIKLADHLDQKGLNKEASYVDALIKNSYDASLFPGSGGWTGGDVTEITDDNIAELNGIITKIEKSYSEDHAEYFNEDVPWFLKHPGRDKKMSKSIDCGVVKRNEHTAILYIKMQDYSSEVPVNKINETLELAARKPDLFTRNHPLPVLEDEVSIAEMFKKEVAEVYDLSKGTVVGDGTDNRRIEFLVTKTES